MTNTTTPSAAEYLNLAKANDRDSANAFIEKHFGALGSPEHNEAALSAFTKEVLDLVEQQAIEAGQEVVRTETVADGSVTYDCEVIGEATTDEVQATNTDSESTK